MKEQHDALNSGNPKVTLAQFSKRILGVIWPKISVKNNQTTPQIQNYPRLRFLIKSYFYIYCVTRKKKKTQTELLIHHICQNINSIEHQLTEGL